MAKKSKAKTPKRTQVGLLLDRTGSMSDCAQETVEGFNAYITELQKTPDIIFTMQQFDSAGIDTLYDQEPIGSVRWMSMADFQPRAATPLIDASMSLIQMMEKKAKKGDQMIVAIQTDGYENASSKYKTSDLKEKIADLETKGWEFVFMGAGIDAYAQAGAFGISASKTVSYGKGMAETRSTFVATASNVRGMAMGANATMDYTADQKMAAGDKFDPAAKSDKKKTRGGKR